MANPLRQPTPPNGLHPHHGPPAPHPQMNGHMPVPPPRVTPQHLTQLNEAVWISLGAFLSDSTTHLRVVISKGDEILTCVCVRALQATSPR